jgi:hypothetical protein
VLAWSQSFSSAGRKDEPSVRALDDYVAADRALMPASSGSDSATQILDALSELARVAETERARVV